LRLTVRRPKVSELLGQRDGESSSAVAERVQAARERAWARQGCLNSMLSPAGLGEHASLTPSARQSLADALRCGRLSARGYHRVVRVARTLADLRRHEGLIDAEHVSTALHLRAEVDLAGMRA
jgi:magnesium chelatase family protein